METDKIKEIIKKELPRIMQTDEGISRFIIKLSTQYCAGKIETEDRFDRVLNELKRDREEQSRKWEEENQKWEEQNRKWEEQNRKWDKNQEVIERLFEELKIMNRRQDQSIGALGARWGLRSEASFRNALKGILEESFEIKVVNIKEFDDKGEVFGRPEQVEIDVIIKNSVLILCEIKSSMSMADMYIFEKKIRFYERKNERKADRKIVISPMVEERAKKLSSQLGIDLYSHADDVENI
ncbi:MAG: DUF3782 domain-containing protein [Thermodesulfobacteriota bacterium]|nr:DUF3782 domain-containing protein [Thermodesulfobacteriota bacterium]